MTTCNTHIGRMNAIGIAKENTPGVAVDPTAWIPVESAEVKPIIKTVEDTSGYGIIDQVADIQPVENTSETTIDGIVRSDSIGHILLATLGEVNAPEEMEEGVFKHIFNRLNSNCPITHTITEDTPAGAKQAPYSVIDSLEIEAKVGDYVRFSVKYIGGQIETVVDKSPKYNQEGVFLASGMSVKMADNTAGLENSTLNVKAQSVKITIEKNPESFMALGSTNVESIHNTVFTVKGDMELKYDSDNYMNMVVDGAKKAIEIKAEGNTIGATKKAEIGAIIPRVAFSEWNKSSDADKITTQTLGFTGTFSVDDAKTLSMWLINTMAESY